MRASSSSDCMWHRGHHGDVGMSVQKTHKMGRRSVLHNSGMNMYRYELSGRGPWGSNCVDKKDRN